MTREALAEWWGTLAYWTPRAIRQACSVEQDYTLDRRRRVWFTVKAVVCMAVNRVEYGPGWDCEEVEVAHANFHRYHLTEFGEAADWVALVVAHRGWRFALRMNGYP